MKPGDLVHVIQQRGTGYYARFIDRGYGIVIAIHPEPPREFGDYRLSLGGWVVVKLAEGVERFHESSCNPLP